MGHGAEFGEDVKGFTIDGSEGLDLIPGVGESQDRRYYAITAEGRRTLAAQRTSWEEFVAAITSIAGVHHA